MQWISTWQYIGVRRREDVGDRTSYHALHTINVHRAQRGDAQTAHAVDLVEVDKKTRL